MNELEQINQILMMGDDFIEDILHYYKFEGNLNDENGNHATGSGTFGYGTDRFGNANSCLSLTNATILTNNNILLADTDKLSISLWFKTAQTTPGCLFFIGSNLSTDNSFYCDISYIGNGFLMFQDRESSSLRSLLFNNQARNDNAWHNLIITNDRSQSEANQLKVYVDNVYISLSVYERRDLSANFTNNFKLTIGKQVLGNFTGLIDSFVICKRILTAEERAVLAT